MEIGDIIKTPKGIAQIAYINANGSLRLYDFDDKFVGVARPILVTPITLIPRINLIVGDLVRVIDHKDGPDICWDLGEQHIGKKCRIENIFSSAHGPLEYRLHGIIGFTFYGSYLRLIKPCFPNILE